MEKIRIDVHAFKKASVFIVEELVDNGFAQFIGDELELSVDTVYNLSQEERDLLAFPKFLDCQLSISTSGVLNTDTFNFEPIFILPNGEVYSFNSVAFPFINIKGIKFLLDADNKYATEVIIKHSNSSNKKLNAYDCINQLKNLENISLSEFLNELEFEVIDQLEILPEFKPDGSISIAPKINGKHNSELISKFDKRNGRLNAPLRTNFTVESEQGSKKMIVSDGLVEEFTKVKVKRIEPWTKEEFIEEFHKDPTLGFDPEKVDLGNFSERVEEIGVFTPKIDLVAKNFNNNWIPALEVKLASGEMVRLNIEDETELENFSALIKLSESTGKNFVNYKGYFISVEHAKELYSLCVKQFSESTPIYVNGRVIPIVKEDEDLTENSIDLDIQNGVFEFVKPPNIKEGITLFDHQKIGVAWMQSIFKDKNGRGALLADDMGLGKTIQILSFIHWHKSFQENVETNFPYLIVAPVSLIENWENEYSKFFKSECNVIQFHGANRNTEILLRASRNEIVITNYESLVSNGVEFAQVNWGVIALDEAQKIKNPNTYVSNVAKSLKSEFNIALTGTPIENKLLDIWNILDFVEPGFLGGRREFIRNYSVQFDADPELAMAKSAELRAKIGFRMLRRLKSEVAKDLPNKYLIPNGWDGASFHECAYEFSELQDVYYQDVKREYDLKIASGSEAGNTAILKAIDSWKRICDHPLVADKLWAPIESTDSTTLIEQSAKLRKTVEITHAVKSKNEKVLVFSDVKLTQRLLKKVFIDEFDISAKVINGETAIRSSFKKDSRQKIVDEFNKSDGFNILILSPVAAGFGLNITGANNVIHYTRHWNPAKENQASDRAYRIGQLKDVSIYHPMSLSSSYQTFDAKLDMLLTRKRMLAENSLIPTGAVKVVELME